MMDFHRVIPAWIDTQILRQKKVLSKISKPNNRWKWDFNNFLNKLLVVAALIVSLLPNKWSKRVVYPFSRSKALSKRVFEKSVLLPLLSKRIPLNSLFPTDPWMLSGMRFSPWDIPFMKGTSQIAASRSDFNISRQYCLTIAQSSNMGVDIFKNTDIILWKRLLYSDLLARSVLKP